MLMLPGNLFRRERLRTAVSIIDPNQIMYIKTSSMLKRVPLQICSTSQLQYMRYHCKGVVRILGETEGLLLIAGHLLMTGSDHSIPTVEPHGLHRQAYEGQAPL